MTFTDKALLDRLPEITAEAQGGEYEEVGGCCSHDYSVGVAIGDSRNWTIDGWRYVGWLAPGAHCDLDGSGLANWGDSQPGGWTHVDSVGCFSGRVRVDEEQCEHDEPIRIIAGEGRSDVEISPNDVPIWGRAVAAADDNEAAEEAARLIREIIVEQLAQAINEAVDAVESPEPESAEIYDSLDEIDGYTDLPVRLGDYQGAGVVLAWRAEPDDYAHAFWPDRDDVERALSDVQAEVIAGIEAEIAELTDVCVDCAGDLLDA